MVVYAIERQNYRCGGWSLMSESAKNMAVCLTPLLQAAKTDALAERWSIRPECVERIDKFLEHPANLQDGLVSGGFIPCASYWLGDTPKCLLNDLEKCE